MRLFLFTILSLPAILFSQNNRFFFVESGTCFNVASTKNFHIEDQHHSTTRYEYTGTIKSMPSYYVKIGVEKAFDLCPRSQISFPISFNYFNEAQKIEADGGWSGCFGSEGGHYNITRNNHSAALAIGLKFISKPTEKISIQTGFNFAPSVLFYSENNQKITNESGTSGYYYGDGVWKTSISFSAQTGLFYQVGSKTKIGLTSEYFFYNKLIRPRNDYRADNMNDYEYGYHGYSALINVGLRLQHSF